MPKAKAAAHKALDIDPDLEKPIRLGNGHLVTTGLGKCGEVLPSFISLSPTYATAHQWYSPRPAPLGA